MLSADANCNFENHNVVAATEDNCTDHDEYQYLHLIRKIMKHGKTRHDRTGTITYWKYFNWVVLSVLNGSS
jgi:hypothetical protein